MNEVQRMKRDESKGMVEVAWRKREDNGARCSLQRRGRGGAFACADAGGAWAMRMVARELPGRPFGAYFLGARPMSGACGAVVRRSRPLL